MTRRMHILGKMLEVLPCAARSICPSTRPRSYRFTINPEKIGEVIGSGGKTINKIIADTGVKIDIEDDGSVYIATEDAEAAKRARAMIIEGIVLGAARSAMNSVGKVVRILPNVGAFLEYRARARTACCTSPRWPTSALKRLKTS